MHVFELPPAPGERGAATAPGIELRALDADWQVRLPVKAGPRSVALTFLNRTPALLENLLEPFQKPVPGGSSGYYTTQKGAYLHSVEISGPYKATGAGETPSRERIFVCRPARASDEDACAKKILSTLARRAFRRPVADADLQTLQSFYKEGRAAGGFEAGVERAVEGLLVSPEFLYRVEREPASGSRADLPHQRSRAGLAPLVFPVEQHPRRRAAGGGERREAAESWRARAAGAPDAGRLSSRRPRHELRGTVAVSAQSADRPAGSEEGSGFRRGSAPGIPA